MVITLLVLLIDASLNSRSPGPGRSLAAGVWVDRILPVITSSNAEGQELAAVWADGLKTPAAQVASEVDQIATGAAANYQAVVKLRPPDTLGGPAGLLEASLLARSKAAAQLQKAFTATLGAAAVTTGTGRPGATTTTAAPQPASDPASVVPLVSRAGSEIQVGDQAYQLFLGSIPAGLRVTLPPSTWGSDASPYGAQAAQVFLATLQSAAVTTPVNQVRIYGVSTTPSPVTRTGAVEVLPDATAITLDVVLADTGNQPANNLTVTASISPASAGSSTVRDFVNLSVGEAYTITALGPLNPPQGVPVTLTVTVTGQGAATTSTGTTGATIPTVTRTLVFEMPAPTPPSTTTTTVAGGTGTPSTSSTSSTSSTTSTTTPGG